MIKNSQNRNEIAGKNEFTVLSDFRYQLRCYLRFSEELTHQHGITNLQYLVMLHIKGYQNREWANVKELTEKLQTHHHGVVALVSRCEKLGLLLRKRSEGDKREVEIHLTPEGDRLVTVIAKQHRDALLELQGTFKVPNAQEL